MAIDFACVKCGQVMRAPEGSAGKRVACPLCGAVQVIPDSAAATPPAVPPAAPPATPPAGETAAPPAMPPAMPPAGQAAHDPLTEQSRPRPIIGLSVTGPVRSLRDDVLLSLVVPFRGTGIFLFALMAVLYSLVPLLTFVPSLGPIALLIIIGWFCAIFLNIIMDTCQGKDELTAFSMTGGFWNDIVRPLFLFAGGTVLVGLPVIAWRVYIVFNPALRSPGTEIVQMVLYGLGLFLWPMTMLTIAINGFSMEALRYDRQLVSIFRALPQYLAIWVLLMVVIVGQWACYRIGTTMVPTTGTIGAAGRLVLLAFVTGLFQSYLSIIAMRVIGLYYRHYKQRFAWLAE